MLKTYKPYPPRQMQSEVKHKKATDDESRGMESPWKYRRRLELSWG